MNRTLFVLAALILSCGLAHAQYSQEQVQAEILVCTDAENYEIFSSCMDRLSQELSPDQVSEDMLREIVQSLPEERREDLRQMIDDHLRSNI